jgi:hypothetical protein
MMSNLTGMAGILVRLGGDAQSWRVRLEKLRSGRLFGRFLTASRQKLRELASRLNVRRDDGGRTADHIEHSLNFSPPSRAGASLAFADLLWLADVSGQGVATARISPDADEANLPNTLCRAH